MGQSEIVINQQYQGLNPVQFGLEDCAPGHSFGPAVRTHWLLHYVVSGFGSFTREGATYRLGPGEIFVIPPFLETYYEADRETPWRYIWVGFTNGETIPEPLSHPVVRLPEAGVLFEEMRRCGQLENGRSAFLSGCLWSLWALLLEQGAPKADYVEKAVNCMRSEYMTHITVQQLATRLSLDRSYFSALFRRQLGLSPKQYLCRLRMEKAAALMVHGERPSTAALSVGYDDLSQFSKMFKRHFGCSPRGYLKKTREEK